MNYDDLVAESCLCHGRVWNKCAGCDALRVAIKELQRDAGRYRWLRDKDWDDAGIIRLLVTDDVVQLFGADLDAAIDKAMEQSHE